MAIAERIGGRRGPQGPQGPQGDPGPAGASVGAPVVFGANSLGTSGTRYMYPGYNNLSAALGFPKRIRVPRACRATCLMLTNSSPGFSADSTGQYTIRLCTLENDVPTPTELSVTIIVTDRQATAFGDVALPEGEEICVEVLPSGTITNSPTDTFVTIGLEPQE